MSVSKRPKFLRFAIAILAPAAIAALMSVTWPLLADNSASIYLLAVIVSSWYGGLWPGVTSLIISLLLTNFFFTEPYWGFGFPTQSDGFRFSGTAIVGILICLVCESIRREKAVVEKHAGALRDSEVRLRAIIDNEPECVKLLAPDGSLMEMNAAGLKMLEADSFEQVANRSLYHVVVEEYRTAFRHLSERVFQGESGQLEFEIIGVKGTRRWLETHAAPLRDAAGKINSLLGITRDITDRKHAEEALKKSEGRYRTLFDYAPDGVAIFAKDGKCISANIGLCKMLGYTRNELLSLNAADFVAQPEIQFIAPTLEAIGPTTDHHREWQVRRKDGSVFSVEAIATAMPDGNILGMIRDITDRKRSEAALRESEERFSTIFKAAPGSMMLFNASDGKAIEVNDQFTNITGYSREEVIGKNTADLNMWAVPGERERFLQLSEKIGDISNFEAKLRHKSGAIRTGLASSHKVTIQGKQYRLGVFYDITELKAADEARRLSDARYRTLFEYAPDGILITDPESNCVDSNTTFCQMLGYSREEMIGVHASKIVAQDEIPHIAKALSEINAGVEHQREWRFLRKDGSQFSGEVMATTMPDGNLLAVIRDISERKRAENERRVISEIIQGIVTTSNLDEFLELVHNSIGKLVYAENCFVMLDDPESNSPKFEFWRDKYDPVPLSEEAAKGFGGYVLRTGKPLLLTDEATKQMIIAGEAEEIGTSSPSWLGVPLRTPSGTIGVLVLQHYEKEHAYDHRDLDFISSVGDQVALAIERKAAEEALGDSEERYRLLFEKNPVPMWVYDIETLGFLEVNDAAEYHYGYSRDEFLSMTILDIRPLDEIPAVLRSVENEVEPLHGGQSWRHRKRDGTVIDVEITSHGLKFLDRSARLVLAKDITETRRTAEALRESEERNRDLVENAIDIIYTHDLDGNYTSVNRSAELITGYSREEALKMNLSESVAPEYLDAARQMIEAKLAGEDVTAYELEIIAKDGHRVRVEVNTRIIYENDVPVSVQGIARDITERKQLEEQFRQAQKMEAVGVLAGGIAHDFNNLLTAINGYSDLTLRRMDETDPFRQNIKEISTAGTRAAELTAQLLAFSRKQVLKPRVHNLNAVIVEIEGMLRRIIRENVEFRTVLEPELGNIKADPGQMEQVIMNLAVNARDAMPNGGLLTIETQNAYLDKDYVSQHLSVSPGPFVKMVVTDTGEGMTEEVQERIFDPFFTTKDVGRGTGLGLSTVFGIVKQSGGDIMVYSELGRGTTFKIYLPCVDEEVQKPRWTKVAVENIAGTETILLIEDEPAVRHLASEVLRNSGYQVLEAASGKDALRVCSEYDKPIHLMLSDVIMPRMSGPEVKDQIVRLFPDIKVLFMSGYTDDAISESGILDQASEFIEKPFTPEDLARKVREVLES